MSRHQKRQLQRLLLIQPRIAKRRIIQAQILIYQTLASARTLRHCIARELEMHTAEEGVVVLVDFERGRELGEDAVEGARFDAGWCAAGVARMV